MTADLELFFGEETELEDIISTLESLGAIKTLDLRVRKKLTNNQVSRIIEIIPSTLKNLTLNFDDNLADNHIEILSRICPVLTNLNLSFSAKLRNPTIKLPNLTTLIFYSSQELSNPTIICQNLEIIDFSYCHSLTNEAVTKLSIHCKNLTKISLADGPELANETLILLSQNCKTLKSLALVNQRLLTDKTIETIIKNSSKLTNLNLTRCNKLVSPTFNCPNLISLDLSDCSKLIAPNINNCPQLTKLCLAGCSNLELKNQSIANTTLLDLCLNVCTSLTDEAITNLSSYCPNITDLSLNDCTGLINPLIHFSKLKSLYLQRCINLKNQQEIQKTYSFANFGSLDC